MAAVASGVTNTRRLASLSSFSSSSHKVLRHVKRVLVTGGAGFIGSHLTEALLARGDAVIVVDDESTGAMSNLAHLAGHEALRIVPGDVRDEELVRQVVEGVDEVYHLAAAVGVALIARQPIETIERNVDPTQLLLLALSKRWLRGESVRFFLASTSEVYGKNPKPLWSEDDDLVFGSTTKARWSYGASKAIDEFLALGYWRKHQMPVVIGRFFNVVGPRQTGAYGMVLPRFVEAAMAREPIVVHDDGQQTRCFAHVSDVVAAVLALVQSPAALGRVFNIGGDQPIAILDLAKRVLSAAGREIEGSIEFQSYSRAYDDDFEDIRRRVPDLSRLRATIEYRPRYDLEAIIRELMGK